MSEILILLIFAMAVWQPWIGAAIVLLARNSVDLSFIHVTIPGVGGLELSDAGLIGLTLGLIFKVKDYNNSKYFILMAAWFMLAGASILISPRFSISPTSDAFTTGVRFGLTWLIPVCLLHCSRKQLVMLVYLMGFLVVNATILQILLIKTNWSPNLVAVIFGEDEELMGRLLWLAKNGEVSRLFLPGSLLVPAVCSISFIYIINRHLFGTGTKQLLIDGLMAVFFISSVVSIYIMRSKSLTLVLAVVFLFSLVKYASKKLTIIIPGAFALVALCAALVIADRSLNTNLGRETSERMVNDTANWKEGSVGIRIGDNLAALKITSSFPIVGTGRPDFNLIPETYVGKNSGFPYLGYDAHGLLMLSIFVGIPAACILLLCMFRSWKFIASSALGAAGYRTAVNVALVTFLVLFTFNAISLFTQRSELTTSLALWGLALGFIRNDIITTPKPIPLNRTPARTPLPKNS